MSFLDYLEWRDRLAEALDDRFYDAGHLDALVSGAKARFFFNDRAAILAEIRTYPTGARSVDGICAAGDLEGVLELISSAEEWGREEGCVCAFINSREAWQRILEPRGYTPYKICLHKEL